MADYRKLIPIIKKWEGGWANDKDDLGGATMMGVTIGTYTDYCRRKGKGKPSNEDLRNITEEEWEDIFKTLYWDRWKADEIENQSIANILVDWVWASGVHGIKRPQRMLGVTDDGIVGKNTLKAVNNYPPEELFAGIVADREMFIEHIINRRPANAKFRNGWLNRIRDFRYEK